MAASNGTGVGNGLHAVLLTKLRAAKQPDWSRAVIDSSHVEAARRGPKSGPTLVDRAHPGSKHHALADGQGIPLAVSLAGENRNDITQLILVKVSSVTGRGGRPRRRPDTLLRDRGYDHDEYRRLVRAAQGVEPVRPPQCPARIKATSASVGRRARDRWLHGLRRLRVRCERRDDVHEASLGLATCLITHRHVHAFVRTSN